MHRLRRKRGRTMRAADADVAPAALAAVDGEIRTARRWVARRVARRPRAAVQPGRTGRDAAASALCLKRIAKR